MENYGRLIASDTLQFERLLPGPIERVWEYLEDSEKRGLWFASGEMEIKRGGQMKLVFNNSSLSSPPDPAPEKYKEYEADFTSYATVLTYEPPKLLVIDWEGGVVTFRLEEQGDQVKLTLTHERLQESKEYRVGTFAGWHTHLNILVDRLNNIDPKGFWVVHTNLEAEYAQKF